MGRFFAITPAPAGANRIRPSGNAGLWNFNSRPRGGANPALLVTPYEPVLLQLPPPYGGANSPASPAYAILPVASTHAPVWANNVQVADNSDIHASTHAPCGGERQILARYVGQLLASTHAPVWGRTPMRVLLPTPEPALQLPPPYGGRTLLPHPPTLSSQLLQLTPHVGANLHGLHAV